MLNNVPDDVRDDFVARIKAAGMSVSDAHETVDLAIHAINQAIETAQSIALRGSNSGVVIAATQLAFGLLSQVATAHAEGANVAARQFAKRHGVPVVDIGEKGGAG